MADLIPETNESDSFMDSIRLPHNHIGSYCAGCAGGDVPGSRKCHNCGRLDCTGCTGEEK